MAQESGPLAGQPFPDSVWRSIFGGEPAIVGDSTGGAYTLTLPTSTNDVLLGSPTVDSTAVVAGFLHRIAAGQTQAVTIPASTNASIGRTDLIVVRYDPAYTSAPGPCRLARVPGVEGADTRPAHATGATGIRDLPLFAITRKKDKALNQSTFVDLRSWSGPSTTASELPATAALGTLVCLTGDEDNGTRLRTLVSGAPQWKTVKSGISAEQNAFVAEQSWSGPMSASSMIREGRRRAMYVEQYAADALLVASNSGGNVSDIKTLRLRWMGDWPVRDVQVRVAYRYSEGSGIAFGDGVLGTDGFFRITNLAPNLDLHGRGSGAGSWDIRFYVEYTVA
ncbi:hypothetical protein CLV28_0718 [Sediminihabitans luteus]|uniref:Uncharacterized protein n=1 Tax=Sediminihabitans luteus TaxID=1138585 RepID=A0A2M9D016_9CELL|nr:hypothetical protein [Sediminihabitans luteus]PJJ77499.1 hypothetical protein CLV28_0718 [Sediminihabitans luteus]GII98396.1 hypothetical protein Slu03_07740 [Sediminihabitans luteus]